MRHEPANTLIHASDQLADIARRLERLSTRQQRRLFRQTGLDAGVIRNEAERCNDILALCGYDASDSRRRDLDPGV